MQKSSCKYKLLVNTRTAIMTGFMVGTLVVIVSGYGLVVEASAIGVVAWERIVRT